MSHASSFGLELGVGVPPGGSPEATGSDASAMDDALTSAPLAQSEDAKLPQERGSLDVLYSKYWQGLCRYVSAKFGAGPPEPADVAQTAFARFAALKDADAVKNPKAFLYATARNVVVDHHRRAQTRTSYAQAVVDGAEEEILTGITPERVLIGKETLQIIRETVCRLPRKQRRVLLLHRLHNQSFAEISRRTGWSQSDVRRQVCRAMAAIERALDRAAR